MNRTDRRQQFGVFLCIGLIGALVGVCPGEAAAQGAVPLRVDPVLLGLPPVTPEPAKPASQDSESNRKDTAEIRPVESTTIEARPIEPKPVQEAAAPSVETSSGGEEKTTAAQPATASPSPTAETTQAASPDLPSPVAEPSASERMATPQPAAPQTAERAVPVPETRPAQATSQPARTDTPSVAAEQAPAPVSARQVTTEAARAESEAVSAVVPPVPAERTPERVALPPSRSPAPLPSSSSSSQVTALEPLRVDPALLGGAPLVPSTRMVDGAAGAPAVAGAPAGTARASSPQVVSVPKTGEVGERARGIPVDSGPTLALRASSKMAPPTKDSPEPRPVFLSAQKMQGEINREFVAEGDAELRKVGSVVNADLMTYWPLEDEVEAEGSVRLQQQDDVMTGPKMRLRLDDRVGYIDQPTYLIQHRSLLGEKMEADREASDRELQKLSEGSYWTSGFAAPQTMKFVPGQTSLQEKVQLSQTTQTRGQADRIDFEGENHYRLLRNTFTTCPVGDDSWYMRTSEMTLDYDRDVGEGKDATVYFKDVPFVYSPWLSFALNNERKSGILAPTFGTSSDNGFELEVPYYWNIAPNMDATFSPRVMAKRGVQFNNEFRYLNSGFGGAYHGTLRAEYLPDDRLSENNKRWGVSFRHDQTTPNGFTGLINYNKVSDSDYYTDLSSDIASTSQTQLLQQGMLTYSGGGWWSTSVNFQQYQTLQPDADNPVLEQYRMLPQVNFNARKPDFYGTDLNLVGQYTHFTIKEREQFGTIYPDGDRTMLYPQISLPYVRPGWYVTPKFGVNYRHYALSGQATESPSSVSVSLPIFSIDSGMTFERSSRWFGRDYTQTLEPRLYYVNIPYKRQSDIPLFDTGLADFNFAQIFSENEFSGWDRVNNANQLTAGLTSRLINPNTGDEIMRAMIGQRYYFTRNKVVLTGADVSASDDKWERSDFLAGFSGQILPKVFVDTALQYNLDDHDTRRYSLGMRYQPEPGKVLNAAYRLNRETSSPINQIDVSGQWPLYGRWHGVGRVNYSFKDDGTVLSTGSQGGRVIESIAGLEYNGGCWILRGVVRRQAVTSEDATTSFFVQLELSGLGRIGSSPLNLLRRNIQGYGLIGSGDSASVFGD